VSSIRIGVNAGSLDPRLLKKYGKATPEALVESALWEASLFEEHGFHDFKISVKHNDPVVMVRAYQLLAEQCDYPLHLGVTEAGPAFQGTIKSASPSGRCSARASATPSASPCRPRRSRRSRSASRSSSR
jgi:(E)-4-hydroxy-3-methylbut-2-enyl-diphosphate synthase